MSDTQPLSPDAPSEAEQAYQQALEYGKDLARVYVAEQTRRKEVEAANQLLSAVFTSTPDGLAVLNEALVVRQANPTFGEFFKTTPEQLIGESLHSLPIADGLLPLLERLRSAPSEHAEAELILGQPEWRSLLATAARLETPHLQGWVIVLHDQTERKRAQEALRRAHDELEIRVEERTAELVMANERLKREVEERKQAEAAEREQRTLAEALRDTAAAVSSTLDLNEVSKRILANVGQVMPHDSASIMYIDEEGMAQVVHLQGRTPPENAEVLKKLRFPVDETPNLRRVIDSREPYIIADTREYDGWVSHPAHDWIRSNISIPLISEDVIIGFLNLDSTEPNFFDQVQAERLRTFADQAAIAIRNARLYEQAQELAVIEERQRLARDLHDAVSQTLWSASLLTDTLPALYEANPNEGQHTLGELQGLIRGALAEMRTLLLELRPETLIEKDLESLIRQLINSLVGRTGIEAVLESTGKTNLPPRVHEAIYRITQESINNIMKHAEATWLRIEMISESDRFSISIQDNGHGYDPGDTLPGHLGIGIMKERAAAVNAQLSIDSAVGTGTTVRVVWPNPEI
ncbi:MAG: GAF domain-containing protein [Anaerolineae bacterium]|nr:GAF domain-containing protein [Anaerolineae bacterium]